MVVSAASAKRLPHQYDCTIAVPAARLFGGRQVVGGGSTTKPPGRQDCLHDISADALSVCQDSGIGSWAW